MARAIDPNYTSPWARWALLVDDHPNATHHFTATAGKDLGIPNAFGGDAHFCVCTIHLNDGSDRTYTAWKELESEKGSPEDWVKIQAKALGRACKTAGYPDNTADLKAVLAWRNRNAEIASLHNTTSLMLDREAAPELDPAPAQPDDAPAADMPDDPDHVVDIDPDTGEIMEAEQ